jgi:hypothetical protein
LVIFLFVDSQSSMDRSQGLRPRNILRDLGGPPFACLTGAATAGPVTVRFPSDVAQRAQTNSCSSPDGSTSSNRSRTG